MADPLWDSEILEVYALSIIALRFIYLAQGLEQTEGSDKGN